MERRSGKTTRLVDKAIQSLFEKGKVIIPSQTEKSDELKNSEFIDDDGNYFSQQFFIRKLKERLLSEHEDIFEISNFKDHVVIEIIY